MRRYYRSSRRGRFSSRSGCLIFIIIAVLITIGEIIAAITDFIKDNPWVIIVPAALIFVALATYLVVNCIKNAYEDFVFEHSVSVRKIEQINSRYSFHQIYNFDMKHSYDNEIFYDGISTKDYLTYNLVYVQREIKEAVRLTKENNALFLKYTREVAGIGPLGKYDVEKLPKLRGLLQEIEADCFDELKLKPCVCLKINVALTLTNINGRYRESKEKNFYETDILSIINELGKKRGDFYENSEIWESICRVERGKVSNKMRFAVYNRDGNRCRRCGSRYNLEVDHIYPISKGGKSNFDNLQTLCHTCNQKKSNTVEGGAYRNTQNAGAGYGTCPSCGAALVRKKGKYGYFYACPNYPKCQFTRKM